MRIRSRGSPAARRGRRRRASADRPSTRSARRVCICAIASRPPEHGITSNPARRANRPTTSRMPCSSSMTTSDRLLPCHTYSLSVTAWTAELNGPQLQSAAPASTAASLASEPLDVPSSADDRHQHQRHAPARRPRAPIVPAGEIGGRSRRDRRSPAAAPAAGSASSASCDVAADTTSIAPPPSAAAMKSRSRRLGVRDEHFDVRPARRRPGCAGSSTVNVVPSCGRLSTAIWPP